MYDLALAYNPSFFAYRRRMRLEWRVPIICDAILKVFKPSSVIDLGCARGEYVKGFLDRGIASHGIEGSPCCLPELVAPNYNITIADLRKPICQFLSNIDLVICFEVAEHIEEEYADVFCDNLIKFSHRILLTAAPPGQGGHYHKNCQPKGYWESKMQSRGYSTDLGVLTRVKEELSISKRKEIRVYINNLMYFYSRGN